MFSKLGDAMEFQSKALLARSARQAALASNIANVDTPGYKARDTDFATALREADSVTTGAQPVATNAKHLAAPAPALSTGAMFERESTQPSQDGNTVDLDGERTRFADNALKYEAALRYLNAEIRMLTSAITG
ncbi:flagellar basal-body rod protein FlgB [Betaproteobacteria bacterium GR16-43]|nr:flagellar basal-body rod protein FlgB [Betaproteobacteria bacterium GR16-43]